MRNERDRVRVRELTEMRLRNQSEEDHIKKLHSIAKMMWMAKPEVWESLVTDLLGTVDAYEDYKLLKG